MMFETSLIESTGRLGNGPFGLSKTFVVSFAIHVLGASLVIAIPMWIVEALPEKHVLAFLVPSQLLEPPLPPPASHSAKALPQPAKATASTSNFVVPERISDKIPAPSETSEIGDITEAIVGGSPGVPWGIQGGSSAGVSPISQISVGPLPLPPRPKASPVRVGGDVQQAKLIKRVDPVYPPLAKRARISGTVILQITVNESGSVEDVTLISGHPLLIDAATSAVEQWVYEPTFLNGEPVAVIATITVKFSLR